MGSRHKVRGNDSLEIRLWGGRMHTRTQKGGERHESKASSVSYTWYKSTKYNIVQVQACTWCMVSDSVSRFASSHIV